MERVERKPFQGITNIIRFNWHFYAVSIAALLILYFSTLFVDPYTSYVIKVIASLILLSTFLSLLVSYYIYDFSDLYELEWLNVLSITVNSHLININAGFDETSWRLSSKYPKNKLSVFDFYNPVKHTEVSIERARRAYAVFPGTKQIDTSAIPLDSNSIDIALIVFSAHEIRDQAERIIFFAELNRVLRASGKVVLVEHLRDLNNFWAYTIGFFHFFSLSEWRKTFASSNFIVDKEFKITPFVSAFILQKNGITS